MSHEHDWNIYDYCSICGLSLQGHYHGIKEGKDDPNGWTDEKKEFWTNFWKDWFVKDSKEKVKKISQWN